MLHMKVEEMGKYPKGTGWQGWLANKQEIVFIKDNGEAVYYQRDAETGAVFGEPMNFNSCNLCASAPLRETKG